METVVVVLSVGKDRVDEFEAGFRQHELPVGQDLQARGLLVHATLNRMDDAIKHHHQKKDQHYKSEAVRSSILSTENNISWF